MNSRRKYKVIYLDDQNNEPQEETYTVSELLFIDNNNELCYSAQMITDIILDLKIGDSIYFDTSRDSDTTKGILKRIS